MVGFFARANLPHRRRGSFSKGADTTPHHSICISIGSGVIFLNNLIHYRRHLQPYSVDSTPVLL